MPKLNFIPSRHGFHFNNGFVNHLPLGITTSGLCGGMSLGAFNYFRHGIPVPTHRQMPNDFGTPDGLPPEGGRLRSYIFEMQIKSFASAVPFFTVGATPESSFRDSSVHFEMIKQQIDNQRFVLLGLRGNSLLEGHQTLVYGYEESPVKRLIMYDCNHPNKEIAVDLDPASRRLINRDLSTGAATGNQFVSYFLQLPLDPHNSSLFTEADKPQYIDLALERAVPPTASVQRNGSVNFEFVIRNFGQSPATFNRLHVYLNDPSGGNREATFVRQNTATSIAPGQNLTLRGTLSGFDISGTWEVGVYSMSNEGHAIPIFVPETAPQGTSSSFRFLVLSPQVAPTTWNQVGRPVLSDPLAVKNQAGTTEVFVRTTANVIARSRENGAAFTAPEVFSGNERFAGNVSGILNATNKIEIFARSANNKVFNRWQNSPNATALTDWSGWNHLGDNIQSDVAVTMNQDTRLEIFAIHLDNHIYKRYHLQGLPGLRAWSASWELMPSNMRFRGNPSATTDAAGRIHVVARGFDRAVYINFQISPNGAYNGWVNFGGIVDDDPVILRRGDGRLEIMVRGTDGKLYHRFQLTPNGNWTDGWGRLTVQNTESALRVGGKIGFSSGNGPKVVCVTTETLDVKYIRESSASPGWEPWKDMRHGGLASNTAIAQRSNRNEVDLFAVDAAQQLLRTIAAL